MHDYLIYDMLYGVSGSVQTYIVNIMLTSIVIINVMHDIITELWTGAFGCLR